MATAQLNEASVFGPRGSTECTNPHGGGGIRTTTLQALQSTITLNCRWAVRAKVLSDSQKKQELYLSFPWLCYKAGTQGGQILLRTLLAADPCLETQTCFKCKRITTQTDVLTLLSINDLIPMSFVQL